MRFEFIGNGKVVKHNQKSASKISFPDPIGKLACYRQTPPSNPLPDLHDAISKSKILSEVKDRIYFLESNNGYITEQIPGSEYYKYCIKRISDSYCSATISRNRLAKNILEISRINPNYLPGGGQPIIDFEKNEVYELRAELTNFIFTSRSILDISATLYQTIYGVSFGQYTSFTGLTKALATEGAKPKDKHLSDYIFENIEWTKLLKDVRDYLAHYGAFRFKFMVQNTGGVRVYVFNSLDVTELVKNIMQGLTGYLRFLNSHWSHWLKDK